MLADHANLKFVISLLMVVDTMRQQCVLVAKKINGALGCTRRVAIFARGDPFPVFSDVKATFGVLCPVLGSPAQGRSGSTGESPVQDH